MHSVLLIGLTHQGMIVIWEAKMAGQGLECGKIMEFYAFFLGKLPLRPIFWFSPLGYLSKLSRNLLQNALSIFAGLPSAPKTTHHNVHVTRGSPVLRLLL
ncbi:hypothetical protein LP7551_05360 [Roseibium album]|nr:hypothetical protein LP7551_05360 [Roseibium album]